MAKSRAWSKWILLFTDSRGLLQVVGDKDSNPLDKRSARRLLREYARHVPILAGQMPPIGPMAIWEPPRKSKKPGGDHWKSKAE